MAVSTAPSGTNYNMATAAGAHAFFLALHNHMVAVGLTQGTTGSDYNVAGTDAQMPTVVLSTSPWLVYDFTDAANATYPITVWFRMVYGYTISTDAGKLRYVLQYRVSEGQSGGVALGDDLQCYTGIGSPAGGSSTSYNTTYSGSIGDFVRYDGNSLTVILGGGGISVSYNSHNSSLCEFHLERRYTVSTGLVAAGFTGWLPYADPAVDSPTQYQANGIVYGGAVNPDTRATVYASSAVAHLLYTEAHIRPTTASLLVSAGAALAAPVYFMGASNVPTPAMKLFTVPLASFLQGRVYTMDFTGVPKQYLIFRPYSSVMKVQSLAYAIEWEP